MRVGSGADGVVVQGNVVDATVAGITLRDIGLEASAWGQGVVVTGTGNRGEVPADATVADNTIEGSTEHGILDSDDDTLDATGNGWGSPLGHTDDANAFDAGGLAGDSVEGDIACEPWCATPLCVAPLAGSPQRASAPTAQGRPAAACFSSSLLLDRPARCPRPARTV